MIYTIHTGDVVDWCNNYSGPLFHAFLSDPPYNLASIQKRFGGKKSKPAKHGTNGAFQRAAKGFMGQSWDTDVAFDPRTWEAFYKVMLPGAFGLAANSTRTFHRMVTAIEDAGFIIHPMMGWRFLSGFSKPTRIDTQIDEAAGIKIDRGKSFNYKGSAGGDHPEAEYWEEQGGRSSVNYRAQTPLARLWEGHRYGQQMIEPAFEPYCLFQKPYPAKTKPYESIVKTGAGALNIKAAWIEGGGAYRRENTPGSNGVFNASGGSIESDGGRWPANLIMDESMLEFLSDTDIDNHFITDWMLERLEDADPVVYAAKASIAEREAGLDPVQRKLMQLMEQIEEWDDDLPELDRETAGLVYGDYYGKNKPFLDEIVPGVINDGRKAESDRPYLRNKTVRYNTHATIKPLSLCRYFARLLLPPDDDQYKPRRLFVPFSGAGSEMIGGLLAGWEDITGGELEPKHVKIAEARLKYWRQMYDSLGAATLDNIKLKAPDRKGKKNNSDHEQVSIFDLM